MKKSLIILLVLILSLQFIVAVEVEMKSSLAQGETILAKISGNFLTSVTKDNLFFYRGHVRVPMEFDITKINDDYYVYALLGDKSPGDYSMSIEGTKYMKGAEVSEEDIIKNFVITEGKAAFSVSPGFIVTETDFSLEIQNLFDNSITISVQTPSDSSAREIFIGSSKESSVQLKSGEIKNINFNLGEGNSALQLIKLSYQATGSSTTTSADDGFCFFWENCTETSTQNQTTTDLSLTYEIPVYTSAGTPKETFRFSPSEITYSFSTNTLSKKTILLHSEGKTLQNISLTLSDSIKPFVNISTNKIESLNADSNISIELSFFSSTEAEIDGSLNAESNGNSTSIDISLNFISNYIPPVENESSVKTCAELNGTICTENEKCSSETVYAKDNVCCLGTCEIIKKSKTGTIIAIIIILLIIIGIVWFNFARYRRIRRKPIPVFQPVKRQEPPTLVRQIVKPIVKVVEKPVIREVEKKVFIEKPKPKIPDYTGSINTKTYHKSSCKFAGLIESKYKIARDDAEYFKKNGYTPCKICIKK
ncbi:hypothetical protein M0R19_06675 [Candidatus Pacearchaeota archaeon]|jgi:hypothetical protein|nr:hypothetical protein [Candidatus Pacearchaeota archaeon]